jgi:hypothetical protein
MSFRCESWIRNASDGSTLNVLITLKAVGSESALPIHTKEPSGLMRNTSRASIVAPRRDKVTRDIPLTRIKKNGRWKTARRDDLSELSILTGGACGDGEPITRRAGRTSESYKSAPPSQR